MSFKYAEQNKNEKISIFLNIKNKIQLINIKNIFLQISKNSSIRINNCRAIFYEIKDTNLKNCLIFFTYQRVDTLFFNYLQIEKNV